MIIQNYGLHWRRDQVVWGSQGRGNQGHLTGRLSNKVRSDPINFRDQSGIYILQDGFRPIYIGQSGKSNNRLFSRLKNHTRNSLAERWDRFSWFGIYPVVDNKLDINIETKEIKTEISMLLNHIEGVLISITEPPLNRQGASFGEAKQYKQVSAIKNGSSEDSSDEDSEAEEAD